MTHGWHPAPDGREGVLAAEAEGYLLARVHRERAHREAEDLCARLPWLTTAQADDLAHHYIRQRNHLTRLMFQDTLRRAAELRQEYESRYADLRRDLLRRHAAFASAVLACSAGVGAAVGLFAR
ncbi:hypothetical protein [Streptomyces phaeoluteigriseus]|uniref:hypothetical protein n=1 Tax=Streptomyces phaeoluteigriseus TaxID=114686 RepID=UPI001FE8D8D6|nr:hypothetical protein [Streptomyces phaeoluteigriseus]